MIVALPTTLEITDVVISSVTNNKVTLEVLYRKQSIDCLQLLGIPKLEYLFNFYDENFEAKMKKSNIHPHNEFKAQLTIHSALAIVSGYGIINDGLDTRIQ